MSENKDPADVGVINLSNLLDSLIQQIKKKNQQNETDLIQPDPPSPLTNMFNNTSLCSILVVFLCHFT